MESAGGDGAGLLADHETRQRILRNPRDDIVDFGTQRVA